MTSTRDARGNCKFFLQLTRSAALPWYFHYYLAMSEPDIVTTTPFIPIISTTIIRHHHPFPHPPPPPYHGHRPPPPCGCSGGPSRSVPALCRYPDAPLRPAESAHCRTAPDHSNGAAFPRRGSGDQSAVPAPSPSHPRGNWLPSLHSRLAHG